MHINFSRLNSASLNETNILENIRIFFVLSVKPVLPSNGTFEVRYEGGIALLKWSTPIGEYTRQVIEQWTNNKRQRKATECQNNPGCTEHDLTKDQTSLTISVEHQDYTFILVLYDGKVPVTAYRAKEEGTVSG